MRQKVQKFSNLPNLDFGAIMGMLVTTNQKNGLLQIRNELAKDDDTGWHIAMSYPIACHLLGKKGNLFSLYVKALGKSLKKPDNIDFKVTLAEIVNAMHQTLLEAIREMQVRYPATIADEAEYLGNMPKTAFGYYD